jgi:hypothetical protein
LGWAVEAAPKNLVVPDQLSRLSPHRPSSPFPTTLHRSIEKPFQINALNLVGKIGLPSSFGENSRIRRENAEMFRLSTLKVARKSFVFKGV